MRVVWKPFLHHAVFSEEVESGPCLAGSRQLRRWRGKAAAGVKVERLEWTRPVGPAGAMEAPAQSVEVRLLGWLAPDCPGLNAGPQGVYRLWERTDEFK